MFFRVDTGQTRLGQREKVGEPLRGNVAHVKGLNHVVPDFDRGRPFNRVNLHIQSQHTGRAQHQFMHFELRLDQCQACLLTLGDEDTIGINHHPGAVQVEPGLGQHCLFQFDPRT